MQLGDAVSFRLHWPRGVDLRANNMMYRPYGRNPSHKLGNNARDEAANVGALLPVFCPFTIGFSPIFNDPHEFQPAAHGASVTAAVLSAWILCRITLLNEAWLVMPLQVQCASLPCHATAGPMCFTGKNRITLTAFDEKSYAFGLQLVRKRSQAEVCRCPELQTPSTFACYNLPLGLAGLSGLAQSADPSKCMCSLGFAQHVFCFVGRCVP